MTSTRRLGRSVAALMATTCMAAMLSVLGFSGLAGAAACGPDFGTTSSGCTLAGATAPQTGFSPGVPFSSGQQVDVVVPANTALTQHANVIILECTAPGGVVPIAPSSCDGNTIQGPSVKPNADGSLDLFAETATYYTVYALPDFASLGETSGPACSLTVECVLYIGDNQNDFTQPHVWSTPFYVNPHGGGDSGTDPGDGTFGVPTVSSVTPSLGSTAGGTPVTIAGTDLTAASAVTLGGTACTPLVVVSSTEITCTSPAGSPGPAPVVVTTPGGSSTPTGADTFTYVTPTAYTAIAPTRICDTRANNPSGLSGTAAQCLNHPLAAGGPALEVTLPASADVPEDASAVVVNVTAISSGRGYVSVYPGGGSPPTASTLNFTSAGPVANLSEVALGTGQTIDLVANTATQVVVDLEGYVSGATTGAGLYNPLATPARICDTRPNNPSGLSGAAAQCNGGGTGSTLQPGVPLAVTVAGVGDVPADGVSAVVLNVTAAQPATSGYLTAYPAGETQAPTASNVNFHAGQAAVPNRVVVQVGTNDQIDLVANIGVNAIVDVSGWYSESGGSGAWFTAEPTPVRICDTRRDNPSGLSAPYNQCNGGVTNPGEPITGGSTLTVQVTQLAGVPAGATAVVLNVTAVAPTAQTFLTVFPGSGTPPTVSDLNPAAGEVEANLTVATISASGTITIYNHTGSADVAVDLAGWYS